jgi:Ca2+-binding EF-hand superfamily protein
MASVSYAAPTQFAAQTQFDMIDANHDGQISRQEMAFALG